MEKKRIVWIDLLRVIGVIGVILIHVVSNTINTFGGLSDISHKCKCALTLCGRICYNTDIETTKQAKAS